MVALSNKRLPSVALALALTFQAPGTTALSAPSGDQPAQGCRVVKDDGSEFVDQSVQRCQDYYPAEHRCAQLSRWQGDLCGLQDRVKAVDLSGPDMIINAHRGVWGLALNDAGAATNPSYDPMTATVGGAAENSIDGLLAAFNSGFRTVEFDVFLVRQDPVFWNEKEKKYEWSLGPYGRVYVTHFTDYAGFTNYRGEQVTPKNGPGTKGYLMSTPTKDIAMVDKLKLRDRNGVVTEANLSDLRTFVAKAASLGVLVVLDIKFAKKLSQTRLLADRSAYDSVPIGLEGYQADGKTPISRCKDPDRRPQAVGPENQTLATIMTINAMLTDPGGSTRADLRHGVVLKFPQETVPCPSLLKTVMGESFDKLLFAPGPEFKGNDIAYVTEYIREWMRVGPRSVAFWDTSIQSTEHWEGKPFDAPESGVRYRDLMDYLYQTTGRRSAIWNIDPSGPGGRHGNFGMAWEHNPNTETDNRGDQNANLVFSGASHALITTDRPDIYLKLRNALKPTRPQEP